MPSTSFIGSIWRESDWARCSPSSGPWPSLERSRWQLPHGCSAIDWRDRELARRLDQEAPGVAASILEGLDEMLTVNRLGLPVKLRRSVPAPTHLRT